VKGNGGGGNYLSSKYIKIQIPRYIKISDLKVQKNIRYQGTQKHLISRYIKISDLKVPKNIGAQGT